MAVQSVNRVPVTLGWLPERFSLPLIVLNGTLSFALTLGLSAWNAVTPTRAPVYTAHSRPVSSTCLSP